MTNVVLLQGTVGSTAYGLDTADSDIDTLGLFARPTLDLVGLSRPKESVVSRQPDGTWHEARKYVELALGCNPTALELLWLPEYTRTKDLGYALRAIRESFLSQQRVRNAYLGYATQQFRLLDRRGDFGADLRKRTEKHARHLRRLVYQGMHLWLEGELKIKVLDPDVYHEFGRRVADGDIGLARKVLATGEDTFDRHRSVLPVSADPEMGEAWLLRVRKYMFDKPRKSRAKEVDDEFGLAEAFESAAGGGV